MTKRWLPPVGGRTAPKTFASGPIVLFVASTLYQLSLIHPELNSWLRNSISPFRERFFSADRLSPLLAWNPCECEDEDCQRRAALVVISVCIAPPTSIAATNVCEVGVKVNESRHDVFFPLTASS